MRRSTCPPYPAPAFGLLLVLIGAAVSCRNDVSEFSAHPGEPDATIAVAVEVADDDLMDQEPVADTNDAEPAADPENAALPNDSYDVEPILEVAAAGSTSKNPLAGCTLCHVDIEDEFIGSRHFAEEVACIDCHGLSEGHLANENNEIKPDEMFAREDVDRLCGECHKCSRAPEAEASSKGKVCTDCHGAHDLASLQ